MNLFDIIGEWLAALVVDHRTVKLVVNLPTFTPLRSTTMSGTTTPTPFPVPFDEIVGNILVSAMDAAGRTKAAPSDLTVSGDNAAAAAPAITGAGQFSMTPTGDATQIGKVINVTIASASEALSTVAQFVIVDSKDTSLSVNTGSTTMTPLPATPAPAPTPGP